MSGSINPDSGLHDHFIKDLEQLPPRESWGEGDYDFSTRTPEVVKARILSVDGGGVRGIIPARVMQEVEARTHTQAAKLFDVMAGSSTGALVTMGLNYAPEGEPIYSAEQMVEFYRTRSSTIFPAPNSWGVFAPKYLPDGLDYVLHELFQDAVLADMYSDVFVPTFETCDYQPWHFSRSQIVANPEWAKLKQRDILRCTTAAPVYFPPKHLEIDGRGHNFVDAGVFANSPALFAAVYAQEVYRPDEIDVLCSLGTGAVQRTISHEESCNWGVYGWGFNIAHLMTASQSEATHQAMEYRFPTTEEEQTYFRFQTSLPEGTGALDAGDEASMQFLIDKAEEMIEEREDELNRMCEKLVDE